MCLQYLRHQEQNNADLHQYAANIKTLINK